MQRRAYKVLSALGSETAVKRRIGSSEKVLVSFILFSYIYFFSSDFFHMLYEGFKI